MSRFNMLMLARFVSALLLYPVVYFGYNWLCGAWPHLSWGQAAMATYMLSELSTIKFYLYNLLKIKMTGDI